MENAIIQSNLQFSLVLPDVKTLFLSVTSKLPNVPKDNIPSLSIFPQLKGIFSQELCHIVNNYDLFHDQPSFIKFMEVHMHCARKRRNDTANNWLQIWKC